MAMSFISSAYSQNMSEAQIRTKINQAASQLQTLQCDFVQTKHLKMLNDKLVSHGKMYYKKSDKLRWEYTTPYHYIFILNGSRVLLNNEKRNALITGGYNQTIDYFKNTLKDKKKTLLDIYEEISKYLELVKSNISNDRIIHAKRALGDLYMNLHERLGIIADCDKCSLSNFKNIFLQNIIYPALFGKIKLNNEKLVNTALKACCDNIETRIAEYKAYLN